MNTYDIETDMLTRVNIWINKLIERNHMYWSLKHVGHWTHLLSNVSVLKRELVLNNMNIFSHGSLHLFTWFFFLTNVSSRIWILNPSTEILWVSELNKSTFVLGVCSGVFVLTNQQNYVLYNIYKPHIVKKWKIYIFPSFYVMSQDILKWFKDYELSWCMSHIFSK